MIDAYFKYIRTNVGSMTDQQLLTLKTEHNFEMLYLSIIRNFCTFFIVLNLTQATSSADYHILELYGNLSLSWYFLNLYIGSPPQIQSLFPDTGSSLTVFLCKQCLSCHKNKRYKVFDRQSSYTNKIVLCSDKSMICRQGCSNWKETDICPFQITYVDETSFKGQIYEDVIKFSNEGDEKDDKFVSKFGCITDQENSYYTLTQNGILGLSHYRQNIFHPWIKNLDSKKRKFGFCYARNGGYIQFGDVQVPAQNRFKTTIQSNYFYKMKKATKILLGSKQANTSEQQRQFIIDTGATFCYFNDRILQQILSEINKVCNSSQCHLKTQNSFQSSTNQNASCFFIAPQIWRQVDAKFPQIQMHIDDQALIWKPSSYLRHISHYHPYRIEQYYVLGIRKTQGSDNILGLTWLQDRRLVLDIGGGYIYIEQPFNCSFEQAKKTESLAWYNFIEVKTTDQLLLLSAIIIGSILILIGLVVKFKTLLLRRIRKWRSRESTNEKNNLIAGSKDNKANFSELNVGEQLKEASSDSSKVAPQVVSQLRPEQP